MTPCTCDQLRDRQDFDDLRDFTEHLRQIQAAGTLVEIPVEIPYANIGEIESWYRCERCDAVWRLVEPDGPFRGVWRRVETHGTSERPAEAPPGMRFVFVYDTETESFPICYQVTPANGGAYNRSQAAITGSVAEEAKEALITDLRTTYVEPRHVISEAGANSWEALKKSFPSMFLHWDTFSDS